MALVLSSTTFNPNPITNQVRSNPTDLAAVSYVQDTVGGIVSSPNTWTQDNEFQSTVEFDILPTSTGTPMNPTDLVTKAYVDAASPFTQVNLTTSSNTPTAFVTVPTGTTYGCWNIFGFLAASDAAGTTINTLGGYFCATYVNSSAGLAIMDFWVSTNVSTPAPGTTSPSVNFTVSGQNILINAIGNSGVTITWNCLYIIQNN